LPALAQKIHRVMPGLKAFAGTSTDRDQSQYRRQAERWLKRQNEVIQNLRKRVSENARGAKPCGIRPGNIVWIFGTARTGSTWLAFMMDELEDHTVWREPYVGELFGQLYYNWVGEKHFETKHFILGQRSRRSWLMSVRSFVLNEATARFPEVADEGYLVIKEPNGSIGAPLMMEALPESRMVFLIRDPRDVIASTLDAAREGSWLYKRRIEEGTGREETFYMETDALVERTAKKYLQNVGNSKRAYDDHRGPKVMVRYEDLRADTLGTMRRIYSSLGIEVDGAELSGAVEKHSWENVPEEEKGEGKFYRKASPGSWREDLTSEQAEIVERITAPLLEAFYASRGGEGEP
jgi:Sulfotransferase family